MAQRKSAAFTSRLNGPANRPNTSCIIARPILYYSELFRLPVAGRNLVVVAGTAWVTVNGRDIILVGGERLSLPARRDTVLISALDRTPLILEVFGATSALYISHRPSGISAA